MQQLAYKLHNKTRQIYIYVGLKNQVATDVIHVLCVCRHLLWNCEITVGVLCFFMLQCLPGSPGQKFRFPDGQLVLLGVKQAPPPFQSPGIGGGLLRSLRLPSGGMSHAGSSSSRMVLWCPGGGKVHLLFEASPHLGEEERV